MTTDKTISTNEALKAALIARGVQTSPPQVTNLRGLYLRQEWTNEAVFAVKDDPVLMARLISQSIKESDKEKLATFVGDAELSFSISRGYEELARKASQKKWDRQAYAFLTSLVFPLDKEAAVALGEEMLRNQRTAWTNAMPHLGPLAQANLPTELADEILLTMPLELRAPLISSRFSEVALRKVVEDSQLKSQLNPFVRMSNPYLSDQEFVNLLLNVPSRDNTPFRFMEFSLERWKLTLETITKRQDENDLKHNFSENDSLPYELFRSFFTEGSVSEGRYLGLHADEAFEKDMEYVSNLSYEAKMYFADGLTTLEQMEKMLSIESDRNAVEESLLSNSHTPPHLIAQFVAHNPNFNEGSVSILQEPNPWSISLEYSRRYEHYGSYSAGKFEEKLNRLLKNSGLAEMVSSPLSWRMKMIPLLMEQAKAPFLSK